MAQAAWPAGILAGWLVGWRWRMSQTGRRAGRRQVEGQRAISRRECYSRQPIVGLQAGCAGLEECQTLHRLGSRQTDRRRRRRWEVTARRGVAAWCVTADHRRFGSASAAAAQTPRTAVGVQVAQTTVGVQTAQTAG